jgi:hypothetical protein
MDGCSHLTRIVCVDQCEFELRTPSGEILICEQVRHLIAALQPPAGPARLILADAATRDYGFNG